MRNVPWEEIGLSPVLTTAEWDQRTQQRKWAIERCDYLYKKAKEEMCKDLQDCKKVQSATFPLLAILSPFSSPR